MRHRYALVWLCLSAAVPVLPAPASAKDCAAWNNWCRPACGDWNAYCAGQSLPQIISRMSPRSHFADPWYYGQRSDTPYKEWRWDGKTQERKKARSAKANAASAR